MRLTKLVVMLSLMVLIVTGLALPVGTFAQDSALDDAQLALINRAVAARNSLQTYTSYVETTQGQSRYEVSAQGSSDSQRFANMEVWSRETTVVRQDDTEYIRALISLAVQRNTPNQEAAYSVDAEARVVDGVLYVNATDVGPESDILPDPLPEGWQVVEDVTSHPVYVDLNLDDLAGARALFDAPDVLIAAASDVTLGTETLDDGTAADAIRISIDAAGMATVLRDYEGATSANQSLSLAMADELDDSSSLEITVVLDDEDTPLVLRTTNLVRAFGVPGDAVGVSDALARVDIISDSAREQTYSRFNDDGLSPAPRPSLP